MKWDILVVETVLPDFTKTVVAMRLKRALKCLFPGESTMA